MADHRNVGLAAIDAARDAGNRWVFPELLDEGLEPWNGARRIFVNASPFATHAVDVTDTHRSRRRVAARARGVPRRARVTARPTRRRSCASMAEEAGERFGGRLAVTFELFEW